MELKHYLIVLWRWAWLLVAAPLLATSCSYVVSSYMPRVYRATTTLMVGQVLTDVNPSAVDFTTTERLAQTYVQLVRRQPLLQATVDTLGLDLAWQTLAQQVNAAALPNTQLIQISATAGDPQVAAVVADELARQLVLKSPTPADKEREQRRLFATQQMSTLQSRISDAEEQTRSLQDRLSAETSARGVQDVQGQITALQQKIATWQTTYASLLSFSSGPRINELVIVESATGTPVLISPNVALNLALAAALGFGLAFAAVLLLEYLDQTVKSRETVDQRLGLPTLGMIGRFPRARVGTNQLVVAQDTPSPAAEAYRVLRTNLAFSEIGHPEMTLMVTSALPGEGKTTTASNLAVALAQAGKRVVLCDADLRKPSVHTMFQVSNEIGLTDLLCDDQLPIEMALVDTSIPNLRVLTSGPIPPNPAELLASMQMKDRLAELLTLADVTILDASALLPVADATIVAGHCSGVVLVADAGRTRTDVLVRVKQNLDQLGVRIIGVVLNRMKNVTTSTYPARDDKMSDRHAHLHPRQELTRASVGRAGLDG